MIYQFAKLHQNEPEIKSYRGYEYAAWFRDIEVYPGTYPVLAEFEARPNSGIIQIGSQVWGAIPGRVVASDFSSYYGGVAVGRGKVNQDVGEETGYDWSSYSFMVAEAIAEARSNIELLPGFHLLPHYTSYRWEDSLDHTNHNGQVRWAWTIVKADERPEVQELIQAGMLLEDIETILGFTNAWDHHEHHIYVISSQQKWGF